VANADPLCAKCHHPKSKHKENMFNSWCEGRFWAEIDSDVDECTCVEFEE
jgi:hypothetical protein